MAPMEPMRHTGDMMDPKPVLTCFTSFVQTKTTYFEGLFDFSCLNQDVPLLSFFLGDAQGIKAAQNDSKIISEHAFSAPKVVRNLFFLGGVSFVALDLLWANVCSC